MANFKKYKGKYADILLDILSRDKKVFQSTEEKLQLNYGLSIEDFILFREMLIKDEIISDKDEFKFKFVKEKPKSEKNIYFPKFMECYHNLHIEKMRIKPYITPMDGKYMKDIIEYLKHLIIQNSTEDITDVELKALELWQYLISKYNNWDFYVQKNLKLSIIYNNLNSIIKNCQYEGGKPSRKDALANSVKDEINRRFSANL